MESLTMPRTVNREEFEAKRNEILDIAQRFIYTKGYNAMTIQDILHELNMSNGSFFHYFKTKQSVLEAVIERIQKEVEIQLLAIDTRPDMSALDKLRQFFETLEQSRFTHQTIVLELLKVWFDDDNAIVREKVFDTLASRRAPLLQRIIQQGVSSGELSTTHPEQTASVVLTLTRGMGTDIARQMLLYDQVQDKDSHVQSIIALYDTYADAIERVIDAPSPFLDRIESREVKTWLGLNADDNATKNEE
jgi:TetR/AcrR family transcriptional repressor of nem operon